METDSIEDSGDSHLRADRRSGAHLLATHGRGTGRKHLAPKGKQGALQLRCVVELVHARLAVGLTLEAMARAAGYSPFQFDAIFAPAAA